LWGDNEKISEGIFDISPIYGQKEQTIVVRFKGDAFQCHMKVSVAKSSEGHKIGVDVAKMIREDEAHKSIIDSSTIGG
jgi:hypothetical protein